MNLYFKRLLGAFVLFLILIVSVQFVLEKGIKKYYSTSYEKFDQMFSKKDSFDVLLLGSSRTHRNIDVRICDSITGYKFYNAGISGAHGYEMFTSLKGYLFSHSKPQFVILNVDYGVLEINRAFYNPTLYLTNLQNNEIFYALKEKGFHATLYRYLPFSRLIEYNDDVRIDAIRGLMGRRENSVKQYHGYLPSFEKSRPLDSLHINKKDYIYKKEDFQYVDSIIKICTKNNIKLTFVVSPVYDEHFAKTNKYFNSAMKKIETEYCDKKGIKFLRFDSLQLNYEQKYFLDNMHLNRIGTEKFSRQLGNSLNDEIFNK